MFGSLELTLSRKLISQIDYDAFSVWILKVQKQVKAKNVILYENNDDFVDIRKVVSNIESGYAGAENKYYTLYCYFGTGEEYFDMIVKIGYFDNKINYIKANVLLCDDEKLEGHHLDILRNCIKNFK